MSESGIILKIFDVRHVLEIGIRVHSRPTLPTHHSHHLTPGSRPTSVANLSHHRLSFGLKTDSTEFMTEPFLLSISVFGRPFVKRFALCYRSVVLSVCLSVCLSCLSVCNVRALWPNGWTDQDETWRAGRPRPWPHCVRWGPSSPSLKGAHPPIFGPYLLRPNGCMDQDVT